MAISKKTIIRPVIRSTNGIQWVSSDALKRIVESRSSAYMVKVEAASQHIREIAVLYERMKVELYNDLKKEFEKDLPRCAFPPIYAICAKTSIMKCLFMRIEQSRDRAAEFRCRRRLVPENSAADGLGKVASKL